MEISISSPSLRSSASTTTAGRRTAKLLPHLETCIKDIPKLLYIHTSLGATPRATRNGDSGKAQRVLTAQQARPCESKRRSSRAAQDPAGRERSAEAIV